jgi:ABC-type antimicrobial peptide transport system permease subunit
VLGASVLQLWGLLSREFALLVLIAFATAAPIAWICGQEWLHGFDYRADFSVWIFVAAGISAITITLLVVSLQSLRAARANPVNSLRSE